MFSSQKKKVFVLLFVCVLLFAFVACSGPGADTPGDEAEAPAHLVGRGGRDRRDPGPDSSAQGERIAGGGFSGHQSGTGRRDDRFRG